MARVPKAKPTTGRGSAARPGAARTLPMRLMSQVPVLGRFARAPAPPPAKRPGRLSPRRLVEFLRPSKPVPAPSRPRIRFVGPMLRGMRQPLVSTAAVVRAAREARKPRTRWERLRDAARMAIDDPLAATKWERLMGLGVGLATRGLGAAAKPVAASPRRLAIGASGSRAKDKKAPAPDRSLGARLRRLQEVLNENAGPGRNRGRRGIEDPKKTR